MNNNGYEPQNESNEKLLFVLSALDDLNASLSQSGNFKRVCKSFLRVILGAVGISKGTIYISGQRSGIMETAASTFPGIEQARTIALPPEQVAAWQQNPDPCTIPDLKKISPAAFHDVIYFWEKSGVFLVAPLVVPEDFIGVICLSRRFMQSGYAEKDLELLKLLIHHVSLLFHNQRLLKAAKAANFQLNHKILEMEQLFDISLAITRLKSLEVLANEILERAVAILDAEYGALWVYTDKTHKLLGTFGFRDDALPSILTRMDITAAQPRNTSSPYVLCIPIRADDQHLGFLAVAGKESRFAGYTPFREDDEHLIEAFANQAAVAIRNVFLHEQAKEKERIEGELRAALEIQTALLPEKPPRIRGLEIAALTEPCRTIGGDFFGFLPLEDKWIISVADISGKGIPAAMLVSTFHAVFFMLKDEWNDPVPAIEKLNTLIHSATPGNKFITAAFLIWDPASSTISSITAGHEPPILARKNGSFELLDAGGMVLGLFPQASFQSQKTVLNPGDCLCIYTDGITDIQNPEGNRFGTRRLQTALQDNHHRSAEEIFHRIQRKCLAFQGAEPAPDDKTLMILRRVDSES